MQCITGKQLSSQSAHTDKIELFSSVTKCTYYLVDMRLNFCECAAGSFKGSCKHKIAIMKYYYCAEFAVIPVNDKRLNASHYRELSQVEIPDDIDQSIDGHRAQAHQDPAVFEEQEPEDNDQENEDENDDDNVPVKSAQLAQHVFKKSPILRKKI